MDDFFEIDFLDVESSRSGDAIPMRYEIDGITRIHVTDGGFLRTGDSLVEHVKSYYGNPQRIDAVVVTHPDGDHAAGLRSLFGEFEITEIWMLRPWLYADTLIDRFSRFKSVESLKARLKEIYPNIAALEELAEDYGVTIKEPFQGERIGEFFVLAPSISRYLDLVVDSEKTPESKRIEENTLLTELGFIAKSVINNIRSLWGEEYFPPDDTSAENNMSVVQFANICNKNILLTGDAGRAALEESIEFAPLVGLNLPGLDYVQVPHHGSRHNVSSELLDKLLGKSYPSKLESSHFTAVVSAAKKDEDHPRKSVVRAFIHRGATVVTTENGNIRVGYNKPPREGWSVVEPLPYPEEQED